MSKSLRNNTWRSNIGSSVISQKANLKTNVVKSTQNFPENKHFIHPDAHTHRCVSSGEKSSFLRKLGVLCFFDSSFEIRPFVLLPILSHQSLCYPLHLLLNTLVSTGNYFTTVILFRKKHYMPIKDKSRIIKYKTLL